MKADAKLRKNTMKQLALFALCLVPNILFAQPYKWSGGIEYLNDTLIFKDYMITPRDTLVIGKGSGKDGQFKYVFLIDFDRFSAGPQPLEPKYINSYVIFKGIEEKTALGQTYPDYRFYIKNNVERQIFSLLKQAFENNELLLPPKKFVKKVRAKDRRKLSDNQP